MLRISSGAITTRVRVGWPSKNGEFHGVAVDTNIPLVALVIGGAIAVAILWIATSDERAPNDEAIEPPTDIALARGPATAS